MYTSDRIEFEGKVYELKYLRLPSWCSNRPSQLSIHLLDPMRPSRQLGWWNVNRQGEMYSSYTPAGIPAGLAEGCKIWMMTEDGYNMPLMEFLTSLGVVS